MGHFLAALFGKLCADEIKAWLPEVANRLKDLSVRKLPVEQRERYSEEWGSHLNEIPGEVGKLGAALGFILAARRISATHVYVRPRMIASVLFVFVLPSIVSANLMVKIVSREQYRPTSARQWFEIFYKEYFDHLIEAWSEKR